MVTLSKSLSIYPQNTIQRPESGEYFYHAVEIEFRQGESYFIVSEQEAKASIPAGLNLSVLVDAVIAQKGLPSITEKYGYDTGIASISGGKIEILDIGDELADLLADKSVNNRGLMNSTCRIYTWSENSTLDLSSHLMYTFVFGRDENKDGKYIFQVSDINRRTDTKIFSPRKWRINQTINAADEAGDYIVTTSRFSDSGFATEAEFIADNDYRFQHDDGYYQDEGRNVRYFTIDQGDQIEVISSDGEPEVLDDYLRFKILERGIFQTAIVDWIIDPSDEPDSKTEIKERIYYEEEPADVVSLAYARRTLSGRNCAAHWGAGIDQAYIEYDALSTYASEERRVIDDPSEVTAKEFVEKEILRMAPAVFTINPLGQLVFTPSVTAGDVGASVIEFNAGNTDLSSVTGFVNETKNVRSVVGIKWGYNAIAKQYLSPTYWSDAQALERLRSEDVIIYETKTMKTGRFAEAGLQRLARVLYDRHINPTQNITIRPDYDTRWVPGGSRCRLTFDNTQDYATNSILSEPFSRDMTLISKKVDLSAHTCTFQFQGYYDHALDRFPVNDPQLTDADFIRGGTEFSEANLSGLTINGAGIASGSPDISLKKKYYSLTPITLGSGFTPNWVDAPGYGFKLWVKGGLFIATTLDLTGLGTHAGGAGATSSSSAKGGEPGHCFTPEAGGWIEATHRPRPNTSGSPIIERVEVVSNPVSYSQTPSKVGSHNLRLTYYDGQLNGFPYDPSGSGGGGTDRSIVHIYSHPDGEPSNWSLATTRFDGVAGGRGGAGFEFVSYAGSGMSAGGKLITSGGDSTAGYEMDPGTDINLFQTAGAGGMPGVLSWGIDGAGTLPVITSSNFEAYPGNAVSPGAAFSQSVWVGQILAAGAPDNHSKYEPTPHDNLWATAFAISYVTKRETLQEKNLGEYSALAEEFDANIRLIVTDINPQVTPPSGANANDIAIWETFALGSELEPRMRQFISGNWVAFDWSGKYAAIGRTLVDGYRFRRSTRIWYGRPSNGNVGDTYIDPNNGNLYVLGATLEEDELISQINDTGSAIFDSYFVNYVNGKNSWSVSKERFALPKVSEGGSSTGGGNAGESQGILVTKPISNGVISGIISGDEFIGRSVYVQIDTPGVSLNSNNITQSRTFSIPKNPANDFADGLLLTAYINNLDGTVFAEDKFIYYAGTGGGTSVAPVANDDSVSIGKGGTTDVAVLANDTGGPDPSSVEEIQSPPHGTAIVQPNGTIRYIHNDGPESSDSFTYRVSNSNGQVSNVARVNVTITPPDTTGGGDDDGGGGGSDPHLIQITGISGRVITGVAGSGYLGRSVYFDFGSQGATLGAPGAGSFQPVLSAPIGSDGNWSAGPVTTVNDGMDGYLLKGYIEDASGNNGKSTNSITYEIN